MVERGLALVYGGGNVGLMGVVADAALAAGGEVIGVITQDLIDREMAHHGITDLRVVATMHERKRTIYELADAMVALPGGIGTLEELLEVLTWNHLGIHRKPCGLLNVEGYYDPLVTMLDRAVEHRFLVPATRRLLAVEGRSDRLLTALAEGLR